MSPKRLEDSMRNMSESIKDKDIIQDLPSIINYLEYIITIYNLKIKGLTEDQRISHVYNIEKYKMDFLGEFVRKYMELVFNKPFSYIITDEALYQGGVCAYDRYDDKVLISPIGQLINSKQTADVIKSILHDFRHQHFFGFMNKDKIEDILDYPTNYIIIAKDYASRETPKYKGDKIEGRADYYENYHKVYMEADASDYALKTVRTILFDLYKRYPNKNKKLEKKINKLQTILIEQSKQVEERYKQEGRATPECLEELNGFKIIDSLVIVDDKINDNLIYTDKYLKNNPMLKEKYKVLSILMKDYSFKNYYEIIMDKCENICNFGNATKITEIYDNIINTDPMLFVTKLAIKKDFDGVKDFVDKHPTFTTEYKEEIDELSTSIDVKILSLLGIEDKPVLKK